MRHVLYLSAIVFVGGLLAGHFLLPASGQQDEGSDPAGWRKGVGWGWIWGPGDEVGALNAMTRSSVRDAMRLASQGRVYDLGVTYSRNSYKWPGHCPCEVMTFRSPEGVMRQGEPNFTVDESNTSQTLWHSCAVFISDNVATQIDGLAHIAIGEESHWYNGFKERDWGGDFGVQKCDATTIPPIVARGVMLDIAAVRGLDVLPGNYGISPNDIDRACERQNVALIPGDVILIRTGTLGLWGEDGADHGKIAVHDSAGITLETAKYLVEHHGAMLIASDTSGLEVSPAPPNAGSFLPVHKYLLVEQGVHIGEFHFLEELARDQVHEFCYVASTNKIAGTTAGFTLRPLAIR